MSFRATSTTSMATQPPRSTIAAGPRFVLIILMLLLAPLAQAFQIGQLKTFSRLGQNLDAEIEIYAAKPDELDALEVSLLPAIEAIPGSAEREAVSSITSRILTDNSGSTYLKLTSDRAIAEPIVRFRLRAATNGRAKLRHFVLALDQPPPPVLAPARTTELSQTALRATPERYGPVLAGQSLWGILKSLGLTTGDVDARIAELVQNNPQAFVDADPNRLKVGVYLSLSAASGAKLNSDTVATVAPVEPVTEEVPVMRTSEASVSQPGKALPATSTDTAATPKIAVAIDPEVQARLDALSEKFASIKARYAAQQNKAVTLAEVATAAPAIPVIAPTVDSSSEHIATQTEAPEEAASAGTDISTVAQTSAPAPVAPPASDFGFSISPLMLGAAVVLIIGLVALRFARPLITRWRTRRGEHQVRNKDQQLVQEIAQKAEKRLKLEDEVKRRLSDTRERAPAPAVAASTIERSVDLDTVEGSPLEEIEHRIAHGQYSEAEQMLNAVIASSPNNHRAKLRLAEIHYLNERPEAFCDLAMELKTQHREDIGDDGWARVMRMGKVIAPDRPPFSGPVNAEHLG